MHRTKKESPVRCHFQGYWANIHGSHKLKNGICAIRLKRLLSFFTSDSWEILSSEISSYPIRQVKSFWKEIYFILCISVSFSYIWELSKFLPLILEINQSQRITRRVNMCSTLYRVNYTYVDTGYLYCQKAANRWTYI